MEDNNDALSTKQSLLRKEIIDSKYDKEAFLDFCISQKEQGDDLDNWTLEELEKIIVDFKKFQDVKDNKADEEKIKKPGNLDKVNSDIDRLNECVRSLMRNRKSIMGRNM